MRGGKRMFHLMILAGLGLWLAGCGTLVRGTSQEVTIVTEPPGAAVALSDGRSCATPCPIAIPGPYTVTARIAKPGCTDVVRDLPSSFPEGGTALLSTIDYQTGAAAEHSPNPLTIALACGDARETVSFSPYDAKTIDLLNGGQDLDVALPAFDPQAGRRQLSRAVPAALPAGP